MSARGQNFYHDLARRYAYDSAAATIHDLYLSDRSDEALARVTSRVMRRRVSKLAPGGSAGSVRTSPANRVSW